MNKQEFADVIFGDDPNKRQLWFDLLKDPVFIPRYNLTLN